MKIRAYVIAAAFATALCNKNYLDRSLDSKRRMAAKVASL